MTAQQQKVTLVADFIEERAPGHHSAFGMPSQLNRSTMQYESPEDQIVRDLKETLEYQHQKAGKYIDFTNDLSKCTWKDVLRELHKAQSTAEQSEKRGKNPIKKAWRAVGSSASILSPGLSAIPDELCVLHGGLALVFSLARHSEMNRLKILTAFENVPNIIEMAQNKTKTLPLDTKNPQSVQLHNNIQKLRTTLLEILPALINKLVPDRFNSWKRPFETWNIDSLLEKVTHTAESVRVCADGIIDELIVTTYSASVTIQTQLHELLQQQRMMQMSIDAAHGKTHLLHFLMEQLNFSPTGVLPGRDQADMSDMGTALPGYAPEDLLRIMDINHLRIISDGKNVLRRGHAFSQADIQRAAYMMMMPQVKELLGTPGPSIVAIDGHFDRTQMGKISPLSYVCAMLSQALRQQPQQQAASVEPGSPLGEKGSPCVIVLEYFCALHTDDEDDLRGPQGLMRCLTTQLILSLVSNEVIGPAEAVHLPYLRDGEEESLAQLNLEAICQLFTALMDQVPDGMPVYCLVDGWSAYEREGLWEADYEVVFKAFQEAAGASNPHGGANFKLLLTSPTSCRWLGDFLVPGQRVSLRNREGSGGNWRGAGRGGLMGLARAATAPDINSGFGGGFADSDYDRGWGGEGYDQRSST